MDIVCASEKWFSGPGWEAAEDFGSLDHAKRAPGKKSDGADMLRSMRRARANLRRLALANNFQYFVPEQHKDGAFHFHGFMVGTGLKAEDSGIRWEGRPVYNLPQWPYGFTTAQQLYGEYTAAVGYCCKYIGKQEGQRPLGRWYYSGGAIAKPEKTYTTMDYRSLAQDYKGEAFVVLIPGSKLLVIHTKEED